MLARGSARTECSYGPRRVPGPTGMCGGTGSYSAEQVLEVVEVQLESDLLTMLDDEPCR